MLFIFIGQSCTGKSTVADKLKEYIDVEVYTGKDYLRIAQNENEAWSLFHEMLSKAALDLNGENIVYLITEIEQLKKLNNIDGACTVKFSASLDVIKARFAQRMNGKLPPPVEKMLERQYTEWQCIKGDLNVDTTDNDNVDKIVKDILHQLDHNFA